MHKIFCCLCLFSWLLGKARISMEKTGIAIHDVVLSIWHSGQTLLVSSIVARAWDVNYCILHYSPSHIWLRGHRLCLGWPGQSIGGGRCSCRLEHCLPDIWYLLQHSWHRNNHPSCRWLSVLQHAHWHKKLEKTAAIVNTIMSVWNNFKHLA